MKINPVKVFQKISSIAIVQLSVYAMNMFVQQNIAKSAANWSMYQYHMCSSDLVYVDKNCT